MNKYTDENGNIAVIYSPGFGAGWYTWNSEYPEMVYDPSIVSILLSGDTEENKTQAVILHASIKYPDAYLGGVDDLTVRFLKPGTLFRINEYDGSESIETQDNIDWMIA